MKKYKPKNRNKSELPTAKYRCICKDGTTMDLWIFHGERIPSKIEYVIGVIKGTRKSEWPKELHPLGIGNLMDMYCAEQINAFTAPYDYINEYTIRSMRNNGMRLHPKLRTSYEKTCFDDLVKYSEYAVRHFSGTSKEATIGKILKQFEKDGKLYDLKSVVRVEKLK